MSSTNGVKKYPNYNCLLRIPNTEENRNKLKELNSRMKEYGSMWRFTLRGRKPKPGFAYGAGGNLRLENAEEIGVYITTRQSASNGYKNSWTDRYQKMKEEHHKELEQQKQNLDYYKRKWEDSSETMEKLFQKLIENEIGSDGVWDTDCCPICTGGNIDCVEDWNDSEEWCCADCNIQWNNEKQVTRTDLTFTR